MNKNYLYGKNQLLEALSNKEYRIGLDLGVGSIGYGIISLNQDGSPYQTLLAGSRIFTPSIGASERRTSRSMRNSLRHKRNRLETLWKFLSPYQMMLSYSSLQNRKSFTNTADAMFSTEIQKTCPYKLRVKALKEKCPLAELGYIFYHIANHRGTSSIRSFLDQEVSKDEQKELDQLEQTRIRAKEKGINTYIELLFEFQQGNKKEFRNKLARINVLLPTRDLILNELNNILSIQKQFHAEIITEKFIKELIDIINYENEKIVPEPGKCLYFKEETKLPKCHFLNEERRLWEALNNTSIHKPFEIDGIHTWKKELFTPEEKQKIFDLLRLGKEINITVLKKEFPEYKECQFTLQGKTKDSQKIAGFRFRKLEEQEFWNRLTEEEQDQFLFDWTNCADDVKLHTILQDKYHLSLEEAEYALSKIQLIGDYAPVGKTALKHILEIIKQGKSYIEAVDQLEQEGILPKLSQQTYDILPYYGQVLLSSTQPIMGKAWHSYFKPIINSNKFAKPSTNKGEEKFGRIANPVVHQTLNELRKLVNEIMFLLEKKPAEIGIELSRELKIGKDAREKLSNDQNRNEKNNLRLYETYCEGNSCPDKVLHFKLAEEQKWQCPYCLEDFNTKDVVSGRIEIEHIFPISQSSDNSYNNKILSCSSCNAIKTNKTPYQAFASKPIWTAILAYIENTPALQTKKRWRFLMDHEQYQNWLQQKGFLDRFQTDTSYITKASAIYLDCLFEDKSIKRVRTLKGGETATLRRAWYLNSISHELGSRFVEDKDKGTYMDSTKKVRLDHRHHALDALVIAYSTNKYTKLINTLHHKGVSLGGIQKRIPIPDVVQQYENEEFDTELDRNRDRFSSYIADFIKNNTYISIKYDHDKNGQLVKGTAYSILLEQGDNIVRSTKKPITTIKESLEDIDKSLLPKVFTENKLSNYTEEERNKLLPLLEHNKKQRELVLYNMEHAEKILNIQNEDLIKSGKRVLTITDKLIIKKALEITQGTYYQLANQDKSKLFIKTAPSPTQEGVAYDTGNNLCVDFYHNNDGKLCGEVIRKLYGMDNSFIPKYKKMGYELLERVYQGDTLEIDFIHFSKLHEKSTDLEYCSSVKASNAPEDRTFLRVATFTEIANGGIQIHIQNLLKAKKGQDGSFNINSMQKYNIRRVILSPLGLTRYRSPILKNKE